MFAVRDTCGRRCMWLLAVGRSALVAAVAWLGAAAVSAQEVDIDFDATGPTADGELGDFFDFLGFDNCIGPDPCWNIAANAINADDGSNALHTFSDGGQLENWFSRVAILREDVFAAENVEMSVDLTYDSRSDANDHAGVYFRFNGSSDVPRENSFYFLRIDGCDQDRSNDSPLALHRVRDGVEESVASATNDPFKVCMGDTVRITIVAEGNEIFVSFNGEPVSNMNPVVDPDPLSGPGRIGFGQNTNPSFFDNITARDLDVGISIRGSGWESAAQLGSGVAGAELPSIVTTTDGAKSLYVPAPNEDKFGIFAIDVTRMPAGETRFPVRVVARQVGDDTNGLGIRNLTIDPVDPNSDPSMSVQNSFLAILLNDGTGDRFPRARDDRDPGADVDPPNTIGLSGALVDDPEADTGANPPGEIVTLNATLELRMGVNVLRLDPTDARDLPEYQPDAGYQLFELTIGPGNAELKGRVFKPCSVRRVLSRSTYFPGDEVTVTLTAANLTGETTIVDTIPEGFTILDAGGGAVDDAANSIAFVATEAADFSYTVMTSDSCGSATFSATTAGSLCGGTVPDAILSCGLQPSGAVSHMLQIGPVDPGRNTGAQDCSDDGRLAATDYLVNADGSLGESNLLVALGDTVAPDFGGMADAAGVKEAVNPDINPDRETGVLTVWVADADGGGRINFNDADNLGDPVDDYVMYSLVYLENNTGECRDVLLEVGSDDAVKVLLNGEVVHVNNVCRGVPGAGAGDMVPVLLSPGPNAVLTAVVERGGGTDVRLIVRHPDGSPVNDGSITASFTPPVEFPSALSADVTRTIPSQIYRPGDMVSVTLDATNVSGDITITESLPVGWQVADDAGGSVEGGVLVGTDFDTIAPTNEAELIAVFDLLGHHATINRPFAATLSADQENPPPANVPAEATGTGTFTFNPATRELSFHIEHSGLSGPETASHIHRGEAGTPGPVIHPLPDGTPKDGSVILLEGEVPDLLAGNLYVNVHTAANPPGEIRGQILLDTGNDNGWRIEPNVENPANPSNALYTPSDGGQLENYFSRAAIARGEIFAAQDVEFSGDITYDSRVDANDQAGLYVRFNGSSDVPLENSYYFVRIDACDMDRSNDSVVALHRVRGGAHEELISVPNDPIKVCHGDTVNLTVRAVGSEISVLLNGQAVTGMDPFVDPDPLLGAGRVGVGQNTNPAYFDNLIAAEVGEQTISFTLAGDGSVTYTLATPDASPPEVELSGLVRDGAGACGSVGGDSTIKFFECAPGRDATEAELVQAIAFNSRQVDCATLNDPNVNYTLLHHSSPASVAYDPARGFGYEVLYPENSPYGNRAGYGVYGPFDDSPNNRGAFADGCPEDLYDSFIGAKDFLTPCAGDENEPCDDVEGIVFRVDVPNGLYRFVAAVGSADNRHTSRILAENGGSGPPEQIGDHVVLVNGYNQAEHCPGTFARVGFDGRVPPLANGPGFINMDENGFITEDCPDSPTLFVTEGYIRLHQLQAGTANGACGNSDPNGGNMVLLELWRLPTASAQLAGDCNQDGSRDVADLSCYVRALFPRFALLDRTVPPSPCGSQAGNLAVLDIDGNGAVDTSDLVAYSRYLFQGGSPPAAGEGCFAIAEGDCVANIGCQ